MQLGKKNTKSTYQNPPKVKVKLNTNDFVIDTSAEIPHGKYQGKTLQYVIDNDSWYYNWMQENNIIAEWDLYRLKETIKKQHNHFVSSTGQIWIDLRLIENVKGIYSPFL